MIITRPIIVTSAFSVLCVLALSGCAGEPAGQQFLLDQPAKREPWSFGNIPGAEYRTEHFSLYTTSRREEMLRVLPGFLEAARRHYVTLTGVQPAGGERAIVYLMADRRQWTAMTEKVIGPELPMAMNVQAGGYCVNGVCVFWDLPAIALYPVAAHEGLHQFLHQSLRQRVPAWVEEGLATQAEGFRISDRLVRFDPALNEIRPADLRELLLAGRWKSAGDLSSITSAANLQQAGFHGTDYYAQLWALLRFIRQDALLRSRLEGLLSAASAGRLGETLNLTPSALAELARSPAEYHRVVGPAALDYVAGPDLADFEQRYQQYARKLAGL